MMRHIILMFICIHIITLIDCLQIHNYLSKEELNLLFKSDAVPQYDVVSVSHTFSEPYIKKHFLELKSFEKTLKLFLHPSEGVLAGKNMPIWTAEYTSSGPFNIKYKKLSEIKRTQIFEDINNLAVLSVTMNKHGKPLLDGIIGKNLRISPLPDKIIDDIVGYRNHPVSKLFNNSNVIFDKTKTFHHIVYKIKENKTEAIDIKPKKGEGFQSFKKFKREIKEKLKRSKREVTHLQKRSNSSPTDSQPSVFGESNAYSEVAYPEILVVIDYNEYLIIGPNYEDVVKYVLTYWHAVDLRFRRFNNPKIRLNIAGIIIGIDEKAIFYINNSKVGKNLINMDQVLDLKGDYFEKEKMFILEKDYDIVATMTSLSLCSYEFPSYCDPSPLGYSYSAGACVRVEDDNFAFVESITLVEDNGGFSGIIPTAHEIGHLLGANHDPFRSKCYNGFIMTGKYLMTRNNFQWSKCSIRDIMDYFRSPRSTCLFNKPNSEKQYPRILPGKLYSLEEQCKIAFNTTPCYYDERVCTYLECNVPNTNGVCFAKSSAAEGSACGQNKICIDGTCVQNFDVDMSDV